MSFYASTKCRSLLESGLITFSFPCGIASDSDCLDGHFPGNPIVPGVVLLGLATRGLSSKGYRIHALTRVKFLRQLNPEVPFEINCKLATDSGRIVWVACGDLIAEARVRIERIHD